MSKKCEVQVDGVPCHIRSKILSDYCDVCHMREVMKNEDTK
jgi:hypothetical protein